MAVKKKTDKAPNGISLVTQTFRVSYPHLFKAQAIGKADPKYSVTMLFAKEDDISELRGAIAQVKRARWGKDKSKWPEFAHPVVINGDKPKYADKEGYAGHWAIKASSSEDKKPGVVDQDLQKILDPAEIYPGCFARAKVFVTTYDNEFGAGVTIILDHVQKVDDGDSIGGRAPAEKSFSPISSGKKKKKVTDDDDDEDDSDNEESDDDADDVNF